MATSPIGADSALVTFPYEYPPHMAAIARILSRYDPGDLARFVTVAIDLLDVGCGDPEAEITDAEDDFADHGQQPWHGPGCPISDPAEHDDDDHEHDGRERDDGV